MSAGARELFVIGLRNAHATERQAQELMERQAGRPTTSLQMQARLKRHLEETRQQLHRLEQCLEACGESPSALKDAALSLAGNVAAMSHAMAEAADERAAIPVLRASLREEEEMVAFVDAQIEDVTLAYIQEEERQRLSA